MWRELKQTRIHICYAGFVLYEFTNVTLSSGTNTLSLPSNFADRVTIYTDSHPVGTLTRGETAKLQWLSGAASGVALRIMVENMGRVNFGSGMGNERKGMEGTVALNARVLGTNGAPLTAYSLSLHHTDTGLLWARNATCTTAPCFFLFQFEADAQNDTFFRFDGWSKVRVLHTDAVDERVT